MTAKFRPYIITWSVVILAVIAAVTLYLRFLYQPWTRDGQVQANIVGVASRVAGPIINIPLVDNQVVKEGDLLFEIDPSTFKAAVDNAAAKLQQAEAAFLQAQQELERQTDLYKKNVTDLRDLQDSQDNYASAEAAVAAGKAELEVAQLNLSYTKIYAPVDGFLTNLTTSPGTYVYAGERLLSLVDASSFWIAAYFKETQLLGVKEGDPVKVTFMGHPLEPVPGVVHSIGWGIYRANGATVDMLPAVEPTIDWVRLPQRFPVRVQLSEASPVPLRIGQTVSVSLH